MKRISLLLLLILIVCPSCSRLDRLGLIKDELETSDNFNDILALKYLRYSDILKKNHDYISSSYFAGLGLDAYYRKNKFSLKLDETLKDTKPETLADLYFLFNCWMYFETQNKNLGEATICKDSFVKITNMLEKNKNVVLHDKINSSSDGENIEFLTEEEELFFFQFAKQKVINIYFDYDNYRLNPESTTKLSAILKYINKLDSDYKIAVVGHADRVGRAIYNNTLARRRANTVYNVLVKNGVPKEFIDVSSLSSKSSKILTRQGEKNQHNRRVEIIIDTNYKNLDVSPQVLRLSNK